jgi:hypothetical protein
MNDKEKALAEEALDRMVAENQRHNSLVCMNVRRVKRKTSLLSC